MIASARLGLPKTETEPPALHVDLALLERNPGSMRAPAARA